MSLARGGRLKGMSTFDATRAARLRDVMTGHVEQDRVGGVAWLAARGDDVEVGVAGCLTRGEPEPVRSRQHLPHRLDDETDRRGRGAAPRRGVRAAARRSRRRAASRARRSARCSSTGVVPSTATPFRRTVRSRCTTSSRSGSGSGWTSRRPGRSRCSTRWASSAWAAVRRSHRCRPRPTNGCAGCRRSPLLYQPGERWLYNTGSDVLGVLIARAAGQPLEEFLRTRVFEPVGMVDTGFSTDRLERLGSCYTIDPDDRGAERLRRARGQWASATGVSFGRGWSRVHARRRARLRPDAAVGRAPARRLAAACLARRSTR